MVQWLALLPHNRAFVLVEADMRHIMLSVIIETTQMTNNQSKYIINNEII